MKIKQIRSGKVAIASFAVVLIATLAVGIMTPEMSPIDSSAVQQVALTTNGGQYELTVDAPDVALDLGSTTPSGTYISTLATTNIYTNAPAGYQLYFSMSDNANHDNRLYLGGDTTDAYISPTAGTFDNPAVLSDNTWGWAMKSADVISEQTGSFDSAYATPTPAVTSKWAAMPTYGNDHILARDSGPTAAAGEDIDIYYGAYVNTAVAAGTYSGEILYTALADTAVQDNMTVSPSYIESTGTQITLATSLATTAADLGTVTVKVGTTDCTGITTSTQNGYLVVTCTAPDLADGSYTITLSVQKFGKTLTTEIEYKHIVRSFTVTTLSETNLSTQKSFYVDTDISYATYYNYLDTPTANTVTVNNAACAGTVTASNNNGNIRYTCSSSPKNLVGEYDVKVNVVNTYDSTTVSATAGTQATYAVSVGSGEMSISPNSVAPSTSQAVTITTTLGIGTGITTSFGTVSATIDGTTCSGASASVVNNVLTISCTAPSIAAAGAKNVTAAVSGYNYSKTSNGIYTVQSPTCVGQLGGTDLATGTYKGYSAKIMNGACWMTADYRSSVNWTTIMNGSSSSTTPYSVQGVCPDGWYVPVKSQFDGLASKYGSGSTLYSYFGLSSYRYFWSATQDGSSLAYRLYVDGSNAGVYVSNKTYSSWLRCVAE